MALATTSLTTAAEEPIDQALLADRAQSVGHLFRQRVSKTPDKPAYLYARQRVDVEEWVTLTWRETKDRVYALGAGLVALGIKPEQRVAIASGTRIEWVLADLAIMVSGAATTTIYPTTMPDDVAYILADSATRIVFAEDAAQVEKLRSIRSQAGGVSKVVVFDPVEVETDDWVMTFDELEQLGRDRLEVDPGVVDARIDGTQGEQLATIIYTSGTTGRPKGVRLLHETWTYQGAACDAIQVATENDLQYLWLPLSHVFGKQLLTIPLQVGFPTAVDGRMDRIVDNLAVVKPTFMGAAPRVFEKAYGRIQMMMKNEGGAKLKLFRAAEEVGAAKLAAQDSGGSLGLADSVKHAALDALVMKKIRERFGGRIRFFISGSAALNKDIGRWFLAMGLPIAEGYGLTESSSAATVNRLGAHRLGSVGWALPQTDIRIADDGEVLLRGPGIMAGYHNNPEATAEVMDDDGWFHTGDIGELDGRGFLTITDRKKDLFKTSGGKYIAPSSIESAFKGLCPYVSQIIVHGEGRNFVTALITLDADALQGWAAQHGMEGRPYAEIVTSDEARRMVQGYVDEVNAGLNRWETIKKFTILDHDLSVESGELTPSLKLRRKVVTDKFHDELEAFYSES